MVLGTTPPGMALPGEPGPSTGTEDEAPTWKPPMPIWRFWLLMLLTVGIYRIFWIFGVGRELRRHQDDSIQPWLYSLGLLIGVASPFVASAVTGHIDRNGERRGFETGPSKVVIVTLAVLALIAELAFSRVSDELFASEESPWLMILILLGTYGVFVPWPWALIQLRMNRLKSAMSYPERPSRPSRFSIPQFAIIVLSSIFWLLVLIGSLPEATLDELFAATPDGELVMANEPISGFSGGYSIIVRSDRWMRVDPSSAVEDADLELVTSPPDSWLVVYTLRGDWAMDDIVNFRRNEIRQGVQSLDSRERRTLQMEGRLPVSHARYRGKIDESDLFPTTWWVTTVVTDSGAVEVVGSTVGGHIAARELEAVVKSLTIESLTEQP